MLEGIKKDQIPRPEPTQDDCGVFAPDAHRLDSKLRATRKEIQSLAAGTGGTGGKEWPVLTVSVSISCCLVCWQNVDLGYKGISNAFPKCFC